MPHIFAALFILSVRLKILLNLQQDLGHFPKTLNQ
ncbi:hypothetical protein [Klebsiella phage 05F01]|nr:hypothetical protein [Klebsiella phage 05F01]